MAGGTTTASRPCRWVPDRAAGTERTALFCLPYAGGGASSFRSWQAVLPGVEVVPVQLPGREERLGEPAHDRMDRLVPALADRLSSHLDGPYALFGHSMGARVAFELTRELRRRDAPPPRVLFVSGCKAPHLDRVPTPPLSGVPQAQFLQLLKRMNGTPPEFFEDPELVEALLPSLRADFAVVETYAYEDEPALDVPISVLRGAHDPEVSEDDALAWQVHTTSTFRTRTLVGGHFLLQARLREIAQAVEADLAQAR